MSESIPVNPDIMRWARETAGYSIEDVVDKIKRKRVTVKVVQDWENGIQTTFGFIFLSGTTRRRNSKAIISYITPAGN
jgi:hypothetical protein